MAYEIHSSEHPEVAAALDAAFKGLDFALIVREVARRVKNVAEDFNSAGADQLASRETYRIAYALDALGDDLADANL